MKLLDLFSGIGGFSLAAKWAGIETIGFCEMDKHCQKVLKKNFPAVPIFPDIKKLRRSDVSGTVDIITGGFPCQPFSVAGRKKGTEDDRDLWPEMLRIIKEFKPTWFIGENVANFINMAFPRTKTDLESEGYEVQPFIIPACSVGAPHRRDRVWIVAHTSCVMRSSSEIQSEEPAKSEGEKGHEWKQFQFLYCGNNNIEFRKEDKPFICRMDDGLSDEVDRLKGLGNSIVPQVAHQILKAIKEVCVEN